MGNSVVSGAIVNRGTISALNTGVLVGHVDTVLGSVSNSGKIVAAVGIAVKSGLVFGTASAGGGINNSGTITASIDGILIANGARISGGVSNGGLITAPTGILIDSASKIQTTNAAVVVTGRTLTGGIVNAG